MIKYFLALKFLMPFPIFLTVPFLFFFSFYHFEVVDLYYCRFAGLRWFSCTSLMNDTLELESHNTGPPFSVFFKDQTIVVLEVSTHSFYAEVWRFSLVLNKDTVLLNDSFALVFLCVDTAGGEKRAPRREDCT